jgi:hypothetical protein
VKAHILEKLIQGNLGVSHIIGLVFSRAMKVVASSLLLTLIVWLVWLGKFTFASFLAGAVLGLLVFLTFNLLKRQSEHRMSKEGLSAADEAKDLTDPEEIRPKASVED